MRENCGVASAARDRVESSSSSVTPALVKQRPVDFQFEVIGGHIKRPFSKLPLTFPFVADILYAERERLRTLGRAAESLGVRVQALKSKLA